MPVVHQIKAARALLEWSQTDLGHHSGLSQTAITNLENGRYRPTLKTLCAIRDALNKAGIEFIDDGVRFNSSKVRLARGFADEMRDFIHEAYLSRNIKEALFFGLHPSFLSKEQYTRSLRHITHMKKAGITTRALVSSQENLEGFPSLFASIRTISEDYISALYPHFVLEDYIGILLCDAQRLKIIRNEVLASAYKKTFDFFWHKGKGVI